MPFPNRIEVTRRDEVVRPLPLHKQRYKALEEGDVEEAMAAAEAIGDDRLQKQSQGRVVPDSFTHGSSAQRVRWFMTGLKGGQVQACDTFRTSRL